MATAISSEEMQTLWRIAEAMHASGDYKGKRDREGNWSGVTTTEQAFNRILIGRDLGLSPSQALLNLDLVRGNLQMRAVLLASFVRQSREYDYEVLSHDERGCLLWFLDLTVEGAITTIPATAKKPEREVPGRFIGDSEFTIEDAAHAKLIRPGSPWETVPRNMVFARAMSNGVKWYCPDLLGGVPVYTEGDDLTGVEAPAIGASEDDTPPGWKGVSVADAAEVEKVVRRAEKLGHAGLANLAAAQMALNDQPREAVTAWIMQATQALDDLRIERDAMEYEDGQSVEVEPQEPEGGFDVPAKHGRNPADALHDEIAEHGFHDERAPEPQEPEMPDARGAAPDPIPGQTTLADAKPEEE